MSPLQVVPDSIVMSGQTPALNPHDIAAEEAILGGLLIDPNAIARIEDILSPADFYLDSHKKIYAVCLEIQKQGQAIDLISLESQLADKRILKAIGGRVKIAALLNSTHSAVNIDQHALLVLGKSRRRSLILAGSKLVTLGHNTAKALPDVMDEAESEVFAVTQSVHTRSPKPTSQSVGEVFAEIEKRSTGDVLPGLSCGFYDIDSMTQGFQRSDLILAAARPAMGKTSLFLAIARNIAEIHSQPVIIFSLEMSEKQLLIRLLSAEASIDSTRLRSGKVADNEWGKLADATARISALPLQIHDQPEISVADIRHHCRHTKATHGSLGGVFIDYLQLMDGGGDNRVQDLAKITRSLKGLARELDVPVFALSQLSRGVESRTNKRPMLSDLRESGALEQDSDIVMMLYREEYYDPDTSDRGIAEIILAKHRNGPTGTVKLLFDAPYTKFLNRASIS